ncbi:MAG: thioesterase family protein [Pseudomonadota bacterium]
MTRPTTDARYRYPVYYHDTDAAGVVHHARLIYFAERARSDLLRDIALSVTTIYKRFGVVFAVQQLNATYHHPARLEDTLIVGCEVARIRPARLEIIQPITRNTDHADHADHAEQTIATVRLTLVCVGTDFRPARLPEPLIDAMQRFCR